MAQICHVHSNYLISLYFYEDNELDNETLLRIDYGGLEDLIPKVGPRAKFWAKLKAHQELSNMSM